MTSSSITDKPIESRASDRLRSERYAQALSDFITSSDTPMTVGLQGEWGTGKTSMMYLIREKMQQMAIATSWVNTWEYSMFKGAAETTPAVLEGMLQELQSSCEKEGQWTLKKDGQETLKKIGGFFTKVGAATHQFLDRIVAAFPELRGKARKSLGTALCVKAVREVLNVDPELCKGHIVHGILLREPLDRLVSNTAYTRAESGPDA